MDVNKITGLIKEKAKLNPDTLIIENTDEAEKFIEKVQRENPGRIAFLPVRPDWNEIKKVFGYYNPLTGLFYPTKGLTVLLNAFGALIQGRKDEKYFIILDEMNLARVEYYFSDILSLMENKWKLSKEEATITRGETSPIHPILDACLLSKFPRGAEKGKELLCPSIDKDECKNCVYYPLLMPEEIKEDINVKHDRTIPAEVKDLNPIPPRIAFPENLVIIGTVNVDETTFSFAPKVLDRAFQLEFIDVHYKKDIEKGIDKGYLELKKIEEESPFYKLVDALQNILKIKNMHFGYRVISEMLDFLKIRYEKDNYEFLNKVKEEDMLDDFDFLLKSKILPKIHGTEEQIGNVLLDLLKFCAKEEQKVKITADNLTKKKLEEEQLLDKSKYKYPDSAKKLLRMYQNVKATGYCSYF